MPLKEVEKINIIIEDRFSQQLPAGGALTVDRLVFSGYITEVLKNHENITVINEEIKYHPDGYTIIATGPLTCKTLRKKSWTLLVKINFISIVRLQIIEKECIDMDKVYFESTIMIKVKLVFDYVAKEIVDSFCECRYIEAGGPNWLEEEEKYFEGCMPFEDNGRTPYKYYLDQ